MSLKKIACKDKPNRNGMQLWKHFLLLETEIFDKTHSFLKNVSSVPDLKKGKLYLWRTA